MARHVDEGTEVLTGLENRFLDPMHLGKIKPRNTRHAAYTETPHVRNDSGYMLSANTLVTRGRVSR